MQPPRRLFITTESSATLPPWIRAADCRDASTIEDGLSARQSTPAVMKLRYSSVVRTKVRTDDASGKSFGG